MEDKLHGLAGDIAEIKLMLRNLPSAAEMRTQSNADDLAVEAGKVRILCRSASLLQQILIHCLLDHIRLLSPRSQKIAET